jgi:hypothetical protein
MLGREVVGLGAEVLAEYNGQKFKLNDLVDVILGTGHGIPGSKTEPQKARFKGVVDTVRGLEFLCRPVVGSSRGPCPQFPRHSVFKITAFGACVLGARTVLALNLPPSPTPIPLRPTYTSRHVKYFFVISFVISVMRRVNLEVHESLVKQRKETKRVKEKVIQSYIY